MDLIKENTQREEFRRILLELASTQEFLEEPERRYSMYKRLEALYYSPDPNDKFRHFYSDIFSILTQIQQNPDLGDINVLGQNLDMIRCGYKPMNCDINNRQIDISVSIRKLYDHVNLDIARLNVLYANDINIKYDSLVSSLRIKVSDLENDIAKASKDLDDARKEIANQQKDYISILGIFASVVLTFTGALTFSTSVFQNIAAASIYRTLVVSLVIGLVLVNILFGLFYYINKLTNKEAYYRPLIISNVILLVLISVVTIGWYCGVVENRNERIEEIVAKQEGSDTVNDNGSVNNSNESVNICTTTIKLSTPVE